MGPEDSKKEELEIREQMRYRDLVLQVERFLKFATKGTDPVVLAREALEFDRRLAKIENSTNDRNIRKLRSRLERIHKSGGRV